MKVLKNNGKRRLGIAGRPAIILAPGEFVPVDKTQIKEMKKNRTVSRWIKTGLLELCDECDIKSEPAKVVTPKRGSGHRHGRGMKNDERETVVLPKGVTGKGAELHHKGGGWYEVYVNGFKVTDTNVRKNEAEAIATEYE